MLREGQLTNAHAQNRMCLGHREAKRAVGERGKKDNSQAEKDGLEESSLSADSALPGNTDSEQNLMFKFNHI